MQTDFLLKWLVIKIANRFSSEMAHLVKYIQQGHSKIYKKACGFSKDTDQSANQSLHCRYEAGLGPLACPAKSTIRLPRCADGSVKHIYYPVFEPEHDKTNKMTCAPSEDSDQPGHPLSLNSLCCPFEETLDP